jgi:carboxyl-terminal processing protease
MATSAWILAAAIAAAGTLPAPAQDAPRAPSRASPPLEPYDLFDPLIDLRAAIVDGHVDDVDERAMQRAALDAMARALGDPYSEYLPPELERSYRDRLLGSFVGIGVELAIEGDRPVVITALDDSPALEAGILPGDVVLAVDGRDTKGVGAIDLESMLPGQPGTLVRLELRQADGTERTVEVARSLIETRSVKGIARDGAGWRHALDRDRRIAYVRVAAFTDRTLPELDAALARIRADGVSGLVLDLRGNGGGSLDAAVGTADRFLRAGGIVSTRGRNRVGRTWDARESGEDLLVPMVVLVNQGSASASEVVAGALQDNRRAVLVGTRTFGKGSVQEIRSLPDGAGALKITTARYYLPSGASVTRLPGAPRWGVEPETGFRVPMTPQELRAANVVRQAREATPGSPASSNAPDVDWASPESVRALAADPQLAAAIDTLQGFLDAGEWRTVGDLSGDVGAGNDELRASLEARRELLRRLRGEDARISELRDAGAGVDDPLLAADADLIDGEVTVRDRDGRVVGRWIIKDPASLRGTIGGAAAPAPEYTPATEPEPGGAAGATPK